MSKPGTENPFCMHSMDLFDSKLPEKCRIILQGTRANAGKNSCNDTLFKTRNIEISLVCEDHLVWYFDDEMIGGVLNNVLVNCARYCRNHLQISAAIEGSYLCISVADDGAGYPESMLVNPSVQEGISFSSGSTRLGLLFAHKVMELHSAKQGQGYLVIANNGPLGGGVLKLYLP